MLTEHPKWQRRWLVGHMPSSIRFQLLSFPVPNLPPVHGGLLIEEVRSTPLYWTMQEDFVPAPKSLAEVENLIIALYEPSNSQLVPVIQSKLQSLQKSPEGWQLADALLNSTDDKVRFFAALTFTVKLNSDWSVMAVESIRGPPW